MATPPAGSSPSDRSVNTQPFSQQPPRRLLEAALRALPGLFNDLAHHDGLGAGRACGYAVLRHELVRRGHSRAAAEWAIHEHVAAGRLAVEPGGVHIGTFKPGASGPSYQGTTYDREQSRLRESPGLWVWWGATECPLEVAGSMGPEVIDRAAGIFRTAYRFGREFEELQRGRGRAGSPVGPDVWERYQPAFEGFCAAIGGLEGAVNNPPLGCTRLADALRKTARLATRVRDSQATDEGRLWATYLDLWPDFNSVATEGFEAVQVARTSEPQHDRLAAMAGPVPTPQGRTPGAPAELPPCPPSAIGAGDDFGAARDLIVLSWEIWQRCATTTGIGDEADRLGLVERLATADRAAMGGVPLASTAFREWEGRVAAVREACADLLRCGPDNHERQGLLGALAAALVRLDRAAIAASVTLGEPPKSSEKVSLLKVPTRAELPTSLPADAGDGGVRMNAIRETPAGPQRDRNQPGKDRQDDIRAAIRHAGVPLTREELVEAMKLKTEGKLGHHLAWMVRNGLLVNIQGRGYWPAGDPVPE